MELGTTEIKRDQRLSDVVADDDRRLGSSGDYPPSRSRRPRQPVVSHIERYVREAVAEAQLGFIELLDESMQENAF